TRPASRPDSANCWITRARFLPLYFHVHNSNVRSRSARSESSGRRALGFWSGETKVGEAGKGRRASQFGERRASARGQKQPQGPQPRELRHRAEHVQGSCIEMPRQGEGFQFPDERSAEERFECLTADTMDLQSQRLNVRELGGSHCLDRPASYFPFVAQAE